MNANNVKLWIDALRSGMYEQGREFLTCNDKDCCLGVACKVYQDVVGDLEIIAEDSGRSNIVRYNGNEDALPKEVRLWLDIDMGYMNSLIEMNDEEGYTFEEIAADIEASNGGA